METSETKKLKGNSPYNDAADNFNVELGDVISEASKPTINRGVLINYILLAFVKMNDFARTRSEADYREARRLLDLLLNLLQK